MQRQFTKKVPRLLSLLLNWLRHAKLGMQVTCLWIQIMPQIAFLQSKKAQKHNTLVSEVSYWTPELCTCFNKGWNGPKASLSSLWVWNSGESAYAFYRLSSWYSAYTWYLKRLRMGTLLIYQCPVSTWQTTAEKPDNCWGAESPSEKTWITKIVEKQIINGKIIKAQSWSHHGQGIVLKDWTL